jgi:hypothetical protein
MEKGTKWRLPSDYQEYKRQLVVYIQMRVRKPKAFEFVRKGLSERK